MPADAAILVFVAEEQAQLGVAIPEIVLGRVGVESILPLKANLFAATEPHSSEPQASQDTDALRVEPDCLLVAFVGLMQLAFGLKGVAKVVVGPRVIGVELEGLAVVAYRLVDFSLSLQCLAEVALGPRVTGVELKGLLVVVDRFDKVVLKLQGITDGAVTLPPRLAGSKRSPVIAARFQGGPLKHRIAEDQVSPEISGMLLVDLLQERDRVPAGIPQPFTERQQQRNRQLFYRHGPGHCCQFSRIFPCRRIEYPRAPAFRVGICGPCHFE